MIKVWAPSQQALNLQCMDTATRTGSARQDRPKVNSSMIEWIPCPALILDRDRTIIAVNKMVVDFLGYSSEELIGISLELFLADPSQLDALVQETAGCLTAADERSRRLVAMFNHKKEKLNVELRIGPLNTNTDSHTIALICHQIEVAEKIDFQNRVSQELPKQMGAGGIQTFTFTFIPPVPYDIEIEKIIDRALSDGRCTDANIPFANHYGYDDPSELYGTRLDEFIVRNDPATIPFMMDLVKNNFTIENAVTFEKDRYGNEIVASNNVLGEFLNGELVAAYGTAVDITENYNREKEFELINTALNSMAEGCIIVDASKDMPIVFANDRFTEITGYSREEILGKNCRFLQGQDTDSNTVGRIRKRIELGISVDEKILNYRKDGAAFWNHLKISPTLDRHGQINRFVASIHDFTEQRTIDEEVLSLKAALAQVTRRTTLGEMAAAIAHEINQPLAAIAANVRAAQRFIAGESPDLREINEILEDINNDDKRAAEVIRRLRAMMSSKETSQEAVNLNELVNQTLELMQSDLLLKHIDLSMDLHEDLPVISVDRIQIQQVILNLIVNASESFQNVKPPMRQIEVSTRYKHHDSVCFSVKDNGGGIERNDISRIFDAFYTTKKEGFGVGLAVNRTIIESHGGQIYAKNNDGYGATISFSLPVTQVE